MSLDRTQTQDSDEQLRAQQLSLNRHRPPVDVPGYEPQRFLGTGAYGEVWVALDRNTGRQVAIKFYAHRGGLDWSLLLREVEKLAFLSADRYVVQLLDVGWDADPPYYVMEYVEQGSLEDRLKEHGPLPTNQAIEVFREVAIGLLHAHAKGVLHCDLKPANVLLDQDLKPRLADFGQSRLSHEQTPALGTLFYMAPEQADLQAVPDARWDVYALGALLYCMLTGAPPHRNDAAVVEIEKAKDLEQRLAKYRKLIATSPKPDAHRKVRGVDRSLAEIIDRSLAPDPLNRYANIQSVLDALEAREKRRSQRPLIVLGALGPALLLLVMAAFTWQWVNTYFNQFNLELRARTLESNKFAARYAAQAAAGGLGRRFSAVEQVAADRDLQAAMEAVINDDELRPVIEQLSEPLTEEESKKREDEYRELRETYRTHPLVLALDAKLAELANTRNQPVAASWLVYDVRGLQLARNAREIPDENTVGFNWAHRSYFNGHPHDEDPSWRPGPDDRLQDTFLSDVFRSGATHLWTVGISTPILRKEADGQKTYIGVLAMTIKVGNFIERNNGDDTDHVSVLVDWREGVNQGLILDHPLFEKYEDQRMPDHFTDYRVELQAADGVMDDITAANEVSLPDRERHTDPMAADPEGKAYDRIWLAELVPVIVRERPTGWYVIVQQSYDDAIGNTLGKLRNSLLGSGLFALGVVALVIAVLWAFVVRPVAQESRT